MTEGLSKGEINYFTPRRIDSNCDLIISDQESRSCLRYDLDYFSDVFNQEEIDKDNVLVESIELSFKKNIERKSTDEAEKIFHSKKRSEALEVIVANQIELNDWLGENALFYRTTKFDDYTHGTDAVAEFDIGEEPERLALAIDSTSRTDLSHVEEKIDRNISKILNNKLEIKYFESQVKKFKGSIKNVIPVVIGLEGGNTNGLINQFAQLIKLKQKFNSTNPAVSINEKTTAKQAYNRYKKEMVKHPAQMVFLYEIKAQLDMYKKILTRENNQDISVKVSDVERIEEIISDVIRSKGQIEKSPEMVDLRNDAVLNLIEYVSKKR